MTLHIGLRRITVRHHAFIRKCDILKTTNHGGRWSNRTYVALALFSLSSTCVVFWSHRHRDIGYTAVMFLPERMYITLDSSASTSHPSLKRHKCIWGFGKATGLHELSSFLLSQYFFSSHNWLKSGITKKPEVVLYLSLLSISPLSLIFCTLSSLMPGEENFCHIQLFNTVNGELVSRVGIHKHFISVLNSFL